jgi:hypothetical protein
MHLSIGSRQVSINSKRVGHRLAEFFATSASLTNLVCVELGLDAWLNELCTMKTKELC